MIPLRSTKMNSCWNALLGSKQSIYRRSSLWETLTKSTAPFCYSEKKYISTSLPQKNASTSNGIIYFNPNFPEFRKTMKKICEIGEKASHNNTIQRKTSKKNWPTLPQLCFIWFFPHKKHHVHLLPPPKKKQTPDTRPRPPTKSTAPPPPFLVAVLSPTSRVTQHTCRSMRWSPRDRKPPKCSKRRRYGVTVGIKTKPTKR